MTEGPRCEIARHSLLPLTQEVILTDLTPTDWLHCASFLMGLLQRAPLSTGSNDATGWSAERWILGCLATELRLLAHEAGETADDEPRTFGVDPIARAREHVAEIAQMAEASEREWQRRLADGLLREERRIAREEAQFVADQGDSEPSPEEAAAWLG